MKPLSIDLADLTHTGNGVTTGPRECLNVIEIYEMACHIHWMTSVAR
jgi:hypothetical protein